MKRYVCIECGYIYDPAIGDSSQDIVPGTAFEVLPEYWLCPICGEPLDMFEELEY